jgi:hypothetical protein
MRTDAQRIDQYDAKTLAATVGLKIAAMLTGMKPSFAAFVNDFSAMQALVTACIAGAGVRPIEAGGYQAFAAKLWKLQNSTADPTLTNVATSYGKQFKSRGLDGATLMKVALDVFTLVIVIP